MRNNYSYTITPDYDIFYCDPEGCEYTLYDDELSNDDISLGPCFRFVIPGMEEWQRRYEDATDFASTTTDPSFDWKSWHLEGLQFAKKIRLLLPKIYKLYYRPPYEDISNTIETIEVDENIDNKICLLGNESSFKGQKPSFKHNVSFTFEKKDNQYVITAEVINLKQTFSIHSNKIEYLRKWFVRIIKKEEDPVVLYNICDYELQYFHQSVGIHYNMGEFIIWHKEKGTVFSAYVDTREFVRTFYFSFMTELGFLLYDWKEDGDVIDPTDEERKEKWRDYNALKSPITEWFITDELFENTPMPETDSHPEVNESFVMFPDYGCTIFWDTMGIGSGDDVHLLSDFGEFVFNIPGLMKWAEHYDKHDSSQSFDEFWNDGWNLAKQIRKVLPENIELFYMCFDPKDPNKKCEYMSWRPRIIVPFI